MSAIGLFAGLYRDVVEPLEPSREQPAWDATIRLVSVEPAAGTEIDFESLRAGLPIRATVEYVLPPAARKPAQLPLLRMEYLLKRREDGTSAWRPMAHKMLVASSSRTTIDGVLVDEAVSDSQIVVSLRLTARDEKGRDSSGRSGVIEFDYPVIGWFTEDRKVAGDCTQPPLLLWPRNDHVFETRSPTLFIYGHKDPKIQVIVDISPSEDFSIGYFTSHFPGGVTTHVIRTDSNLDAGTTYYWRAHFQCEGRESHYTETQRFTIAPGGPLPAIPTPIAPVDDVRVRPPIHFRCAAVKGAHEYRFTVSTAAKPNRGRSFHTSAPEYILTEELAPGRYLWRIKVRSRFGYSDESNPRPFIVEPPLAAP